MGQFAVVQAEKPVGSSADNDWLTMVVAFVLMVGLPTAFWTLVLELLAPMFGFEFGITERIYVAVGLVATFAIVWAFLCGSSRSGEKRLTDANSHDL